MKELSPASQESRFEIDTEYKLREKGDYAPVYFYGDYFFLNVHPRGVSVGVVSPEAAETFQKKQQLLPGEYLGLTVFGEGVIGVGSVIHDLATDLGSLEAPVGYIEAGSMVAIALGAIAYRATNSRKRKAAAQEVRGAVDAGYIECVVTTLPSARTLPGARHAKPSIEYCGGQTVAYADLIDITAELQGEAVSPYSDLVKGKCDVASLVSSMMIGLWSNEGRTQFISGAFDELTSIGARLLRYQAYETVKSQRGAYYEAHRAEAIEIASSVAGIIASYFDARSTELLNVIAKQHAESTSAAGREADERMIEILIDGGVISKERSKVIASLVKTYKR